jgi:tetratricopeptide (TPR) repeat protein
MIVRALVVSLLFTSVVFAQAPEIDSSVEVREAISLIDSRRFDEAITKLNAVLAREPENEVARYELGLAYAGKGNNEQCLATLQPVAQKAGQLQAGALAMMGNCYDGLGQRDKAVEAYRLGLKISPDESALLYNLAVTLGQTGKLDEALPLVKNNVRKNPWHISSHALLAEIFELQGFRVPAAFSFLRFLALEPTSPRSADAAKRLRGLMSLGVETTKKGANITIDPNSRKEEGDFTSMELMLAMVAASETLEKKRGQSEFERAQGSLVTAIRIFLESREKEQTDFTSTVQGPFFNALDQEKLLETFAGLALSSLQLRGTEPWMKKNAKEIERYRAWVAPQRKAGVPLPS